MVTRSQRHKAFSQGYSSDGEPALQPLAFASKGISLHANDSSSYTSAGLSAVAVDERPLVVVGARFAGAATINSVLIGGTALSLVGGLAVDAAGSPVAFYLGAPGQSGQVTANFSVAMVRGFIGMWGLRNLAQLAARGSVNTANDNTVVNIAAAQNGAIFAAAYATACTGFTWTGVTERSDLDLETGSRASLADLVTAVAAPAFSLSADGAGTLNSYRMAAVSLR